MTDWKERALAAEAELAKSKGEPVFKTLQEELIANLPDPEYGYSENGTEGDPELPGNLAEYFADKPERGYKEVGWDEVFEGRNVYPPFTEIFLFEVDGTLYRATGESDSWEGGWPMWQVDSIRPVKKVTKTVEVTDYVPLD